MKLLFTSDLHGSEGHYARLVSAAKDERPEVVVLGGDLLPDDSALHPEKMGVGQPEFVKGRFREIILALRDASACKEVLVIFGNHDWRSSAEAMKELAANGLVSVLCHTKPVEVDGLAFLGYSCTPPTPWYVKDFERLDLRGDRPPLLGGATWDPRFSMATSHGATQIYESAPAIADDLAALKPPAGPWVFVAHAPPFDSHLDRSYEKSPWGSRAVREAIEKFRPTLSLHGHIHESPVVTGQYQQQIGKTVAVNPGQTRAQLSYAVIDFDVAGGRVADVKHKQRA